MTHFISIKHFVERETFRNWKNPKLKPLSLPNKTQKHVVYIYWSKLLFQAKSAMEASREQSAFTFTISTSHKQGLLCTTDKHYGSSLIIHPLYSLRAGKIWCCGFQRFFLIHSYSKLPQKHIKELIKRKGFICRLQLAKGDYSKPCTGDTGDHLSSSNVSSLS